ncbi:hypothetical protein HW537_14970, partial [Asaia siamensis]
DQRRDFFSQDIRASGPTLKAEFAGIIEFKNWGDVKATDWGVLQVICSLYRLNSDGSSSLYTAEQRRLRVDRNAPMPITVNAPAVNLNQGETLRAVITIVTLDRSRQDFTLIPLLSDAALTWLSV